MYALIGYSQSHILADTTWLTASGRVQNAIEYCMQVRKTGQTSNESNNSAPVEPRIKRFRTDVQVDVVYGHTGYDVTCYFRSAVIGIQ